MLKGPSQYYYTAHMLLSVRNMRTPWATYRALLHREEEMKRFHSELKVKSTQTPQETARLYNEQIWSYLEETASEKDVHHPGQATQIKRK